MTDLHKRDRMLGKLALIHMKEKNRLAVIKRKRSWKDSEKVMAASDVMLNLEALDYAIEAIKAHS